MPYYALYKTVLRNDGLDTWICCTSTEFHYLFIFTVFIEPEVALNLICMKYLWNRHQSIGISATGVKLNLRKYFKIYWKNDFRKILFPRVIVKVQYVSQCRKWVIIQDYIWKYDVCIYQALPVLINQAPTHLISWSNNTNILGMESFWRKVKSDPFQDFCMFTECERQTEALIV